MGRGRVSRADIDTGGIIVADTRSRAKLFQKEVESENKEMDEKLQKKLWVLYIMAFFASLVHLKRVIRVHHNGLVQPLGESRCQPLPGHRFWLDIYIFIVS